MRMNLHILSVMTLGVLTIGCAKIEHSPTPSSQHLIGYEVIENKPASKAAFPTTETFMSTAYILGSGLAWDADKAYATKYFDNLQEEVSYEDLYWKTNKEYYWPPDGESLTFFSYTPKDVGATISIDGVSVTGWNVVSKSGTVILVADIAKDKTKNESYAGFSGVPTLFRHKLSKVSFRVAKSSFAEEGVLVSIKSIKIVDIYVQGNYSRGGYSNDAWSGWSGLRDENDPYVVYDSTGETLDKTPVQKGTDMIMIPQMLSAEGDRHPRVLVEYMTSADATIKSAECFFVENFRSGQWAKGQHYTYTIYIGVGQYPIEFDGDVSDWSSSDQGSVTVN